LTHCNNNNNNNNNNVYSRTKARAYISMIKLYTVTIATRTKVVQSTPATIGPVQVVKGSSRKKLLIQRCNRHQQQQNGDENTQSSATNIMEEPSRLQKCGKAGDV